MAIDPRAVAVVEQKARAGDAQAQFMLALYLGQQGRAADARHWLDHAAASGHPEALAHLALIELRRPRAERATSRARAQLEAAASRGSNAARLLLASTVAQGIGDAPDWSRAVALVLQAARAKDPVALRQLAFLAAMSGSKQADRLLLDAARSGDGIAAVAVIRRHRRGHGFATAAEIIRWVEALKRGGHPLAGALTGDGASAGEPTALDWASIEQDIRDRPQRPLPTPARVSERPAVWRIEGLLSPDECDYVIGMSAQLLQPSAVVDPLTGKLRHSEVRTSSSATLSPGDHDLVLHALNLRMAQAAGAPADRAELLGILMYRPGEEYKPHFDFFGENVEEAAELAVSGQRVRTLLVALNDGFAGGETQFLHNGIKVKGALGDAILFANVDESGAPDYTSRHAGLPVTSGVKWLASTWFRARPFVR